MCGAFPKIASHSSARTLQKRERINNHSWTWTHQLPCGCTYIHALSPFFLGAHTHTGSHIGFSPRRFLLETVCVSSLQWFGFVVRQHPISRHTVDKTSAPPNLPEQAYKHRTSRQLYRRTRTSAVPVHKNLSFSLEVAHAGHNLTLFFSGASLFGFIHTCFEGVGHTTITWSTCLDLDLAGEKTARFITSIFYLRGKRAARGWMSVTPPPPPHPVRPLFFPALPTFDNIFQRRTRNQCTDGVCLESSQEAFLSGDPVPKMG